MLRGGYPSLMKIVVFVIYVSTKHVNTQIYFCDQTKAIATCSARLAAGKLRWRCKTSSFFDHRYCGLWLFSRVWYACSEKNLWIQLANVSAQDRTERFFDTILLS